MSVVFLCPNQITDAAKKSRQRVLESNRGIPLECAVPEKSAVPSYPVTASSRQATDREDGGITYSRNVGSYTLSDTASHLRRFKFPTRPDYLKAVRTVLQTTAGYNRRNEISDVIRLSSAVIRLSFLNSFFRFLVHINSEVKAKSNLAQNRRNSSSNKSCRQNFRTVSQLFIFQFCTIRHVSIQHSNFAGRHAILRLIANYRIQSLELQKD
jgi:hypothetical protein